MLDLKAEMSYPSLWSNSSWLPLLLMSLSHQKHTPDTKSQFKSEYDYIVVGSGPAGCVVASRVSEVPFVDVLLLEAGKSPPLLTELNGYYMQNPELDWNFITVPQNKTAAGQFERRVTIHAGKCIGGGSVINGMIYVRGNADNYNSWEKEGNKGWGFKDVLPYFKKMEQNFAYPADPGYHGNRGPITVEKAGDKHWSQYAILEGASSLGYPSGDYNGYNQKGVFTVSVNQRYGRRCSAAKAYLVPAENRKNLDIIQEALVTKILIEDSRAVGVKVEYKGQSYEVRARKEVILSAGAINSAKLLMLSGIGPADHLRSLGIPVNANLQVGNNFQDHLGTSMPYQFDFPSPSFEEIQRDPNNILEYIFTRTGYLTSTVINLAFLNNGKYTTSAPTEHEIIFFRPFGVSSLDGFTSEYVEYLKQFKNKTFIRCLVFNTNPKSRGTIRLKSDDPHDPPIIDPNYYSEPKDFKGVVEGLKHCKEIFESKPFRSTSAKPLKPLPPGCQEFENDEEKYFGCLTENFPLSGYHLVGTAKMGPDTDSTAVVDNELRVLGIEKLRVVDGSIMPTITSGNTHVPIIMIGEKASDLIKKAIFNKGNRNK